VAIEIEEAVLIHEPVILRLLTSRAAGLDSSPNQVIHFGPAGASKAVQNLEELGSVTNGARRERGEDGLHGKHELNGVADNKADTLFSAELIVDGEAESGVKRSRSLKVFGGKVDDDLTTHGGSGIRVKFSSNQLF
jgi:hypothetical protein